ncbi:hybrid sensor histidine kinase/response regulator [Dolichospermum compactum]|uniref:histidine kinase n=1 Tax=Dolichospermum compactum NIES-806 TaxID=1973481 RepID=A0A1Z4UY60_9CYAN|nr:ATP-binding protein [Dolichospermum compactum]BAZ84221.1 two-component hybrid sensor and regulator [Dolichospermum compactum NIES-806]
MVVAMGILWASSRRWLMRVITNDGGVIARWLLLLAIIVTSVVGWLIVNGELAKLYNYAFAISLLGFVVIILLIILIWQSAIIINHLSHENCRDEDALKIKNENLQTFANANIIGIISGDISGGIHDVNDEFLRIIGYTREDLLASNLDWRHLTPPEFLYLDEQAIAQSQSSVDGGCVPYQKEYIRKDGSRIPVLVGFVLRGEKREKLTAFILDLSERETTLRKLQKSKKKILKLNQKLRRRVTELQTLLDMIPIGIGIAKDPECQTISMNPAFAKSLRMQPDRNASMTAPVAERPTKFKLFHQGRELTAQELPIQYSAAHGVEILDFEVDVVHDDGTVVNLLEYVAPLFDEDGKPRGAIGAFLDITERKQAEKDRTNLITSLQTQTEQLRKANQMKDEFLAVLSHELRSPLNAIVGWSHLLRTRQFKEDQIAQGLETIERNAKIQNQLIDDLLDISRIIRGKLKFNPRICDLVSIIKSAMETVSLAAEGKGIHLDFNTNDGELSDSTTAVIISGDSDRLQQVIWNLLTNAIKFTPQGGNIQIRLNKVAISPDFSNDHDQPRKYAQIQVIDNGIGITAEFIPYVFDRFRQADSSSTRSYGGLGLGLSLVRHLTELHGGTVDVASLGENQGSTFTVKLPLIEESHSTEAQKYQQKAAKSDSIFLASPTSLPILDGVKVLVVDDEVDSREFVATVLEECQAEVTTVSSAQEALEILNLWTPDVLISDIGMPEENGYSLIRKVRSLSPEKGRDIPAAALTAYTGAVERMQAIQAGFQLHLPKPIEPMELATVVASLVKRNFLHPDS